MAVIGYPARDSRVPDSELMDTSSARSTTRSAWRRGSSPDRRGELQHDCTTLGGNSGSVLLDLATGEAVGLHFSGVYLRSNYAVPASVVAG